MSDHYAALGLCPPCCPESIGSAFRALALKLHPDKAGQDKEGLAAERFRQIRAAYEVLHDPLQRSLYDRAMGFGTKCSADSIWERAKQQAYKDGLQPSPAANHLRQPPAATKGDAHTRAKHHHGSQPQACRQPMSKHTQAARGAARPAPSPSARQAAPSGVPAAAAAALPPPRRGRSFCCDLDLTFLEGVFGTRKTFTVSIPDAPCPLCGGLGRTDGQGCQPCKGRGKQQHERRVTLELGPSLVDGDTLKVPGEGYPARPGYADGDLVLTLCIAWEVGLLRTGSDVWSAVRMSPAQAASGSFIVTNTVHGPQVVNIPPKTQHDDVIVLEVSSVQGETDDSW
eukprot:jgi/Astpho2/3051/Aster-x1114